MTSLQKLIMALGMEPNIASALLILFFTFVIVITIFFICVMFLLIGIRNQLVKIDSRLRAFDILITTAKINKKNEAGGDDDKFIYEEKSSKDTIKFQLDNEDIKKLQDKET